MELGQDEEVNLVVLDAETFYAPDYSLSKKPWTTQTYIRSPRFKCHGAGLKINGGPSRWITHDRLPTVLAAIPWHKTALIGHNLQFDASILAWRYGCYPALYIDTLGMSRALVGQHSARHGLHYVAPILTQHEGHPLHKMDGLAQAMGIRDLPPWREQILADYTVKPPHYNPKTELWEAGDAELTWHMFKRMAPLFPKKEYKVLDWTIRKFVQPKLYLDDDLLTSYLEWVREEKQAALERAGLDSRDMLMSNPKYAAALESLGVVPPTKINAKGKVTFAFAKTDEGHKALLEHDNPTVQAIVAARMKVKSTIEETRAEAYLEASALGPWPVAYSYSGAVNTHRFSGNKGGGGNPMNLKRGGTLRDCIFAPPGKRLLVFDQSQIECRLALWLGTHSSKTTGMERQSLDMMAEGDSLRKQGLDDSKADLYSFFAGMMYGREILKGRDKVERQGGKSAVLGLGFGMGPTRFIDYNLTLGNVIDAAFAESTVHLYRNTYKGVRAMWRTWEQAFKAARQQLDIIQQSRLEPSEFKGWNVGPAQIVLDPLFNDLAFQIGDNLLVKYPDLQWDAEGECTYRDGNHRVNMFGGKWMENFAQHAGRIILTDKAMEINETYEVQMTTYDELVMLVDDNPEAIRIAIDHCSAIMEREHPLFPGLPLGYEYGHGYRYGQAKQ